MSYLHLTKVAEVLTVSLTLLSYLLNYKYGDNLEFKL